VDTNCNPMNIDYVIPSNDDAIRAIKLLVGKIADAVLEGKAMRKEEDSEEKPDEAAKSDRSMRKAPKVVETEVELEDTDLLGEATLAKLATPKKDVEEVPVVAETSVMADAPEVKETPAESDSASATEAPADSTPDTDATAETTSAPETPASE